MVRVNLSHIFYFFRLDALNPTMMEEKVMLVVCVLYVVQGVVVQSKLHYNIIISNIQYYAFKSHLNCIKVIAKKPFHIVVGYKSSQIQR